jgi:hypothetical protein
MESAWGVEHGSPITKSLVGQNKFVPAVKLGAKRLKAARAKMMDDDRWHPAKGHVLIRRMTIEGKPQKKDLSYPLPPGDPANGGPGKWLRSGVYRRRGDARTDLVTEVKAMGDGELAGLKRQATSKTTFRAKNGKTYPVHIVPDYPNAHPIRTGSKKHGKTEIVSGRAQAKADTMRHEVLHADGKSSWRTAQINSRPRAQRREEARADTISGTYRRNSLNDMKTNGGILSHTAGNRISPGRSEREFRRTQDQIFRSRGQSPRKETKASGAPYIPTPGRPNDSQGRRMVRYGIAGGGAAGAYGGAKYGEKKYGQKLKGRQRRASDGKFA